MDVDLQDGTANEDELAQGIGAGVGLLVEPGLLIRQQRGAGGVKGNVLCHRCVDGQRGQDECDSNLWPGEGKDGCFSWSFSSDSH